MEAANTPIVVVLPDLPAGMESNSVLSRKVDMVVYLLVCLGPVTMTECT